MGIKFDNDAFDNLAESLDDVFPEIVDAFFDETEASIKTLNLEIDKNNIDEIHNVVHKIKSSTKTFGATGLVDILNEIEMLTDVNNKKSSDLKNALNNEYTSVKQHILNKM